MSLASKKPTSLFVLSTVAILYFGVQWLAASTMGGCRIFSPSMRADRADFSNTVDRISTAARFYCASGNPRKILFQDGDVVTPYIVGDTSPLGHCEVVRVTAVTPFTETEVEECGDMFVQESLPPRTYDFERGFWTDPVLQPYNWPELYRWVSEDGRYGFAIYIHPCAAPVDRKK